MCKILSAAVLISAVIFICSHEHSPINTVLHLAYRKAKKMAKDAFLPKTTVQYLPRVSSAIIEDVYIFMGDNSVVTLLPPFCKGSILEEKICSLWEQILFVCSRLFSEGLGVQKSKQKVTKVVSLVKNGGKST